MRRTLAAVVVGIALFAVPACSGKDDGGGMDVHVNPSGVVVASGGTTVQVGGGGSIPEGFPSAFPLPQDATPVYSASGGGSYSVWFNSAQSVENLKTFFDSGLPANGWTIQSEVDLSDTSGAYTMYTIAGDGFQGTVYLGEGGAAGGGFSGDFAFWVSLAPSA